MKYILKNAIYQILFFLILTTTIAFLSTLFRPSLFYSKIAFASSSPAFTKTYQTLTINQKIQYKVKNLKKTNYVYFSVSNSSLASIEKRNGWLTAKKVGKLIVKATIYNKNHKKIKTLTNTISIRKKKAILPNAVFKVKDNINPYNFTISLSCSRIALKKEINKDKLTILPKGKKKTILTASFTNLSSDGREITYTLSSASKKLLCPGDFSMNGSYTLKSRCFSKKLSINYEERLTKNTLSGFVLKTDGSSIKNALVSLKKDNITIQTCFTDNNGHYQLQNISDATALTAEKSGFQKSTIFNPAISSKGTTCENIILRSLNKTNAAIEFFVTDQENHPLSNAAIYVLESSKANPIDNPLSENNTSYINTITDSFSKKDILFSGNTDSSGKLLLANTTTLTSAPCSNLIIGNQNQLTYSPVSKFSSTNKTILPNSILNFEKYYTIYIKYFSSNNLQSGYHTRKINFSFSHLLTNHTFLHIKLNPCQQTYIKNLSLSCETPPSLCRSLLLQFFCPEQKKTFYQYSIEKEYFKIMENQIVISSHILPVTFPDDTYYLSMRAQSEEKKTLAESSIVICQITNSVISLHSITLQKPHYARILVYGAFKNNPSYRASFQLFQKKDEYYFEIGTFSSQSFSKAENEYAISDLYLTNLLPNQSYVLVPLFDSVIAKNFISFTATKENTCQTKENAIHSLTPLTQIDCSLVKEKNNGFYKLPQEISLNVTTEFNKTNTKKEFYGNALPDNFYSDTFFVSYTSCHTISQEFVRSTSSYPNCVIAIYKSDGTLLSTTFSAPPADKINISNSFIMDIYTNKEILITNQDFYKS